MSDFPRYSKDDYAFFLLQMFRNTAVSLEPNPTFLEVLSALGASMARAEEQGFVAAEDRIPDRTISLIDRWEDIAGLPDECLPTGTTLEGRQRNTANKIGAVGIQNSNDAADVVRRLLGLFETELIAVCQVDHFRMFEDRMTDRLYGVPWLFGWVWNFVNRDILGNPPFRMRDRMGTRLFGLRQLSENVTCLTRRYTPAHLGNFLIFEDNTICQ